MPTKPPGTPDLDLTDPESFGLINGGVFMTGQTQPAGTGQFNSFVQIQNNGVEQGYNTDASAQYNEKNSHQHNHSLLLAEVPIVIGDGTNGTIEGMTYREFLLDLNEQNGGTKRYLSLDSLQIWQEEAGNLTNFTPGAGFAGAHTNYLAYNLDAGGDRWIALDSGMSSGSGQSDYRILIPDSLFINDAAHRYVTLYSEFGVQPGWDAGGGFEEWGTAGENGGSVSAIALSKSASVPGGTADQAGEVITYSFQLSNTGNTSLTGVAITDALVSDMTRGADITGDNDSFFEAGEVWSYTGHHTLTQAEIDTAPSGESDFVNTATADTDQTGPVSATATVTLVRNGHVVVTKAGTVPGGTADTVGEVISYMITVTNDGNLSLGTPVVFDVTNPVSQVDNPASPVLVPVTSGEDIVGDINGNSTQDPGEVWIFRNAGDSNQNFVEDDGEEFLFHNIGDTDDDGELDIGETWQYTASHTVNQFDIDNGGIVDPELTYSNTAQFTSAQGVTGEATEEIDIEQRPNVTLTKTATVPGGTADTVNEIITYAIAVANDGNMTLTNLVVSDSPVGDLAAVESGGFNTGDADMDSVFDVGETWQYTASHTVTQADIDNGGEVDPDLVISNTATATTDQASDSDTASVDVDQNPHISMTKTATVPGGTADAAGEVISYAITVANNGNMTLSNPVVSDPSTSGVTAVTSGSFNAGDGDTDGVFDVGEVWQYAATHTVTQGEIDDNGGGDGFINNTASATTTQGANASASASVAVTQNPHISMTKTATVPGGTADTAGEVISYAITVANNGNMTLSNPVVSDPSTSGVAAVMSGSFNAGDGDMDGVFDVGEIWQYAATHAVTQAEIDDNGGGDGFINNTASATTTQGANANASAAVEVEQPPAPAALFLDKSDAVGTHYIDHDEDGVVDSDGDLIQYAFQITNTGGFVLHDVTIDDPLLGGTIYGPEVLDPGESFSFTLNYFLNGDDVGAGHVENTATASGLDPSNNVVSIMAHYDQLLPA